MSGDFNKPAVGDNYTAFAQAVRDIVADMIKGLDPALTLGTTNIPANAIRWNSANGYWEKFNGTTWAALASSYAINISGTAAKWGTGRTITLSGDMSGTSGAFDGSANLSFASTLATVNANTGAWGSASQVAQITLDGKGRATAAANVAISIAWSQISSGKPTTLAGYGITDAAPIGGSSSNDFYTKLLAVNDEIYVSNTNGTAALYLNYRGYAAGLTQFRNVIICDGKGAEVLNINGAAKSLTLQGPIAASNLLTLEAGTWTPTITNVANVAASSLASGIYQRVGNVVTFSGRVNIDPVATGVTDFYLSLPIASNFTSSTQATGVVTAIDNGANGGIYASAGADKLEIAYTSLTAADGTIMFAGSYVIA